MLRKMSIRPGDFLLRTSSSTRGSTHSSHRMRFVVPLGVIRPSFHVIHVWLGCPRVSSWTPPFHTSPFACAIQQLIRDPVASPPDVSWFPSILTLNRSHGVHLSHQSLSPFLLRLRSIRAGSTSVDTHLMSSEPHSRSMDTHVNSMSSHQTSCHIIGHTCSPFQPHSDAVPPPRRLIGHCLASIGGPFDIMSLRSTLISPHSEPTLAPS